MNSTPDRDTYLAPAERAAADTLLAEAFADSPAITPPPAPSIPPGFRLVETTRPDGTTVREFIPETPAATTAATPAALPDATLDTAPRVPAWALSARAVKAYCALVAVGAGVTVAVVYGPAIGAGLTAAAAAVWAAVVTAAKVIGTVVLVLGVAYVLLPRRRRTGTFEGTVRGTWSQD